MVGILSGAYSTIFIATPFLVVLKEREPEFAKRKSAGLREKVEDVGLPEERAEAEPETVPVAEAPVAAAVPVDGPAEPGEGAAASATARREARRNRRRTRPHGRAR
jgi:hypothetical protein